MTSENAKVVRIEDYQPASFAIDAVVLRFDLGAEETFVSSRLALRRVAGAFGDPLRLDGHGLELLSVSLGGQSLEPDRFKHDENGLEVFDPPEAFLLETRVRIRPKSNQTGLGMYLADGALVTQCETEGFRRLTYFLDRPDVLSIYDVTLAADRTLYPVLLSNGHPTNTGVEPDGRHWVRWSDPIAKPSYIFAVVAGQYSRRARNFQTASGRQVELALYANARHSHRCEFALDSLERAMRWEEETWGVEYDLDLFNIVAADGFGSAMENKGLNIFEANELVTDPDRTIDDEYVSIEITVGHEYFHNLTGNRITVRDWFQKALKEGLTRFRDRSFSAAMGAADMRRLDFVSMIVREQFREDDGPGAHAVQPTSYIGTPDFVTMTIYDKGAEIFRMLRTLAGADGFRAATDLYVRNRDGSAARLEDFLADYGVATGRDIAQFRRWFDQVGRPRLSVARAYDAQRRRLEVTLSQSTPPTPGQGRKEPLHIPVLFSLRGTDGKALPGHEETLLELTEAQQTFVMNDVPEGAIPSVLRSFSAPVTLQTDLSANELAALGARDDDTFVRWHSMQRLGVLALRERLEGPPGAVVAQYATAWREILLQPDLHPGMKAHLLQVPNEPLLSEGLPTIDLEGGYAARRATIDDLVGANLRDIAAIRERLKVTRYVPRPDDMAARRLRNLLLLLMCQTRGNNGPEEASAQFDGSDNLTDRVAAFAALLEVPSARDEITDRAERVWAGNDAAMTHWYRVQAALQSPDTAKRLIALSQRPDFDLSNPTLLRSLTFPFFRANRIGLNAPDGQGYVFLERVVRHRDARMPERVHWLLPQLMEWRRYDPERQISMRATLARLGGADEASEILKDLCARALAD